MRYKKNTIYPLVRREIPLLGGLGRQTMWHIHLDIKGDESLTEVEVAKLIQLKHELKKDLGITIDDQPFCRFHTEQIALMLQTNDKEIATLLADPDRYGAPRAHWTIKSSFPEFSDHVELFGQAFQRIAEVAKTFARPLYVEVERVKRIMVKTLVSVQQSQEGYVHIPLAPFRLVTLSELDREFRDTEVHITFEDLRAVDPRIFTDLFQRVGFRIAYRRHKDDEVAIVATVQGFEPDISKVFVVSLDWISECQQKGLIRCDVTIKTEDVVWHYLIHDPYQLPVILPGSLRSM